MARLDSPSIAVCRERDRSDADCTVVRVRGEHDIATKVSLAAAIAHAAQLDDAGVVIDLSGVTFMDAAIVGAIVGSANRLRWRSQSLEFRAPSRPAFRILELCGLTHLLHTATAPRPTRAEALGTWIEVPSTQPGEAIDRGADHVISCPMPPGGIDAGLAGRLPDAAVTVEADRGGP